MSDFDEIRWARAGRAAKARSEAQRRQVREAVKEATEKGLEPVPFASGRAAELAAYYGLAWPAFQGRTQSSHSGFTAADVRTIIGAGAEADEE